MSELMPIIGVCGPSGAGKSSSIENLPSLFPDNKKAVAVLDLERKGFPFLLGDRFNHRAIDNYGKFDLERQNALKDGAKVIVVESWTKFSHFAHEFADKSFKGFDVFKNYNKYMRNCLESLKNTQAIVIITGINEAVTLETTNEDGAAEKVIDCFACATGKEMRGKIEQDMLLVLHAFTDVNKQTKQNTHLFLTQTDGVKTAKAPKWLNLPRTIPNDLAPVVKCLLEGKPWETKA